MSGALKIVGVDLGGTRIRAVLSDRSGEFASRIELPTEASLGQDHVIGNIVRAVGLVLEGTELEQVAGLGIGAPGPLNPKTGVVYSPPNLPGWVNTPLQAILEERLGLPVYLGNDANLAALGEVTFGAGKDYRYLVYLTISTGIGGGVINEGRIVDGVQGAASEIGHMTIEAFGPRCNCGNYGCLEVLASGTAIRRRAIEALQAGQQSKLTEMADHNLENITAEMVETAARQGDSMALELLHQTAIYLGVGVTNVLHLFNPEIVLLGGGVMHSGDLIFEPLLDEVKRRAMPIFKEKVVIAPTKLGGDIGLYGAVALVLQNYAEAEQRKVDLALKRSL